MWQHGLLEGPLSTTESLPVVVERPGRLNRDAGPDFFDARLTIGGIQWAGNVEVHIKASDWKRHGHDNDKSYNNVVLHVVYVDDAEIRLESGKTIPTVVIASAIPEQVWESYDQLMNPTQRCDIPCGERLKEIPDFLFKLSQDRLGVERMERKSGDVHRILQEVKGGWEQACYQLVAHYFGGKANAFPFELMAKVTPMGVLAKINNEPFRVESLYFGQAGMLEGELSDDYARSMQKEYNYMRTAYKLRTMPAHLWKFFRLRPASFPTLRISQFAALMSSTSHLFSLLLEAKDVSQLRKIFAVQASDYWQTHYSFDIESCRQPRKLGKSFIDNLIINAWVPLLFEFGAQQGNEGHKEQAFALLQQLPPENNRIVRMWVAEGVEPRNSAESQALIQRYTEYCSSRRCLECPLAFRLIKSRK